MAHFSHWSCDRDTCGRIRTLGDVKSATSGHILTRRPPISKWELFCYAGICGKKPKALSENKPNTKPKIRPPARGFGSVSLFLFFVLKQQQMRVFVLTSASPKANIILIPKNWKLTNLEVFRLWHLQTQKNKHLERTKHRTNDADPKSQVSCVGFALHFWGSVRFWHLQAQKPKPQN